MDKFQYGGLLFDPSHYQTLSYIESKHNNKLFINPDFKKGKAGYMQLSPIAFADLKEQGFFKDREYSSLTPQEVLAGSMKYASRLGEHYGFTDPKWNAAAYNMGPSKARELYNKYAGKLNKAVLDPAFPQTTKDYLFDYNYTTLAKDRHTNADVNTMYDIIKNDQDVNSLNIEAMSKKNKTPKYFWGALIQAGVNKIKEEKAKDKAFMNSSNMGAAGTALGSMITSAGDAIGTQEDASKANVIQGAAVSTLGGLMSGGIMGGLIAAPTSLIKYSANAIAQGSRKESQQEAWINGHTTGIDTGTNYQFKLGGVPKYHMGSDTHDTDPPKGNTYGVPVKDTIYPNGNNKFLFDKYKNPDYIVHSRTKGRELSAFEKTLDIVDRTLSAPSRYMVQAVTGKYQDPSEAWGYKDPKGFMQNAANFGIDMVADPMNLLGVGLASKAGKVLKTGRRIVPEAATIAEATTLGGKGAYYATSATKAREYFRTADNLKKFKTGAFDWNEFKDYTNMVVADFPELKETVTRSLKLNKPEATAALINDAINIKQGDTDTYEPHYSKTSNFGPLAAGYKGLPNQKQGTKFTKKLTTIPVKQEQLTTIPVKQEQLTQTLAAAPSPMVMNQFNKIVNGKKVPISKEEFQTINSKGKITTDTMPTYLKGMVPDSLKNKQKLQIRDISKKEMGGYSIEGYRKDSPDKNKPYVVIPGTNISMQDVLHKVLGVGSNGQTQVMMPGQQYNFGASTHVTEYPIKRQKGGNTYGYATAQNPAINPVLDSVLVENGAPHISTNSLPDGRAYYDLENHKIHIGNDPNQFDRNIIGEVAHAKQFGPTRAVRYRTEPPSKEEVAEYIRLEKLQIAEDMLRAKNTDPSKYYVNSGDSLRYVTPGTVEHDAHSVIEPKIREDYDYRYKRYIESQNANMQLPPKKQQGGPPDVVPMSQITPLQTSKDELVIHPNYDVTKTAARKTHAEYTKTGQNEKVSDTLQPLQRDEVGNVIAPGAYVVSNAKELKIPVALAKQMSLGVDPAYYAKDEHLPEAKERNVADEFFNNKKEMTPAELLKSVLKKIPEPKRDSKTDMFAKQTSVMNKAARVPMLEIIKKTNDFLRNINAPEEAEAMQDPEQAMQDPNAEQMMYEGGVPKYQYGTGVMPSYLNYPLYGNAYTNNGNVLTGQLGVPGDGSPPATTPDYSASPFAFGKNMVPGKDWKERYNEVAKTPEGTAINKYSQPAKAGSPATPDYMQTLLQQIQGRKYPGNANNAALAAMANGFGASMLSALQNPTNEVYATNPTLMDRKFAPEDVNLRTRIYDNSMANRDAITLKGLESTGVSAQKSQFYLQSNDNVEKRNAAVLSAIQANNQLGRAKANAIDQNRRGIVDQNNTNQKDYNRYLYNITKPLSDTAGNIGNIYQQDAQNRMAFDDRKERDMISVQQGQYMMDILNKQSGINPAASGTTNTSTIPIFKGTTQEEWEAFKKKYNIA